MPSSRSRLILRVVGGKKAGTEVPVEPGARLRIGRAPDCQLRLQSQQVSRHHCEILFILDGFRVKDCGSRTGTFVDEVRVDRPTLLNDGQLLRIGPFSFRTVICQSGSEAADAAQGSIEDAEICQWLDEPPVWRVEVEKGDEGVALREVLRVAEQSCDAAERALHTLKRRK